VKNRLARFTTTVAVSAFALATLVLAANARAQTLTTLHRFCTTVHPECSTEGDSPKGSLVQGIDGNLYGTTSLGGTNDRGTAFEITPRGALTTLYSFCAETGCADGDDPVSGMVQDTNGNLYGITQVGDFGGASIFKVTPSGTLTTLFSWYCGLAHHCPNGGLPLGPLVQAANGELYGTTFAGNGATVGGTVFEITKSGLTTLYGFPCDHGDCPNGSGPVGGLVQAANGDLYGATAVGGHGNGALFKVSSSGALTTLYSFCAQTDCPDGSWPTGGMVQGSDGDLYGTTAFGGTHGTGNAGGTVFKITLSGELTTLHSFCAETKCVDGEGPMAGLVRASDGDLYGTTQDGGAYDGGTIFRITPSGVLTTVYNFCAEKHCPDGAGPVAALIQGTNGYLYGTTEMGGTDCSQCNGYGTIFGLDVGLGPFVETLPKSASVGSPVKILGTNLTGATGVAFNGIATAFTVVSASEIATTVPTGATTGTVQVVTPSGTLSSNMAFRVTD
jgi:uncharacterized repeat protein (TIGR03803 family)